MDSETHISKYLEETIEIAKTVDRESIAKTIDALCALRDKRGRLFIIGVGGSAANASHMVNDFRKLCQIEAYTPVDNVAELTAWTNDEGWESVFASWLAISNLRDTDAIFILSVGGGSDHTSRNLVLAMEYAKKVGAKILGIVSRDGGKTKQMADVCILVPVVAEEDITTHSEGWQGVLWHLMIGVLKKRELHWEKIAKKS